MKELIERAREAIDSMDDFARMAGVEAVGPLKVLNEGVAALEQQAQENSDLSHLAASYLAKTKEQAKQIEELAAALAQKDEALGVLLHLFLLDNPAPKGPPCFMCKGTGWHEMPYAGLVKPDNLPTIKCVQCDHHAHKDQLAEEVIEAVLAGTFPMTGEVENARIREELAAALAAKDKALTAAKYATAPSITLDMITEALTLQPHAALVAKIKADAQYELANRAFSEGIISNTARIALTELADRIERGEG